jgi:D-alanine-D-alanine ligase
LKILVLSGGDSPEREVSLRSGKAVADALIKSGFEILSYDPLNGDEELAEMVRLSDYVFPILHGINGEDGIIQKKLEELGAKYLGSNSEASENSFYKDKTHSILALDDVLMPKYVVVTKNDLGEELFSRPFVLKPLDGGSSVDTLVARTADDNSISKAVELLNRHESMLLEELIEGREITVPILDEEVLPVIAIIPPKGSEFDFENKYNGATQEICPAPVDFISKEKQNEAQKLSLKVHQALKARHLSRVDIIMNDEGQLFVLELNTIPGMTSQSLFPNSANVAGYSMEDLVKKFVDLVEKTEG